MKSSLFEKEESLLRVGVLGLALFLLAASWWAPYAQTFLGRHLFLTADSMIALGLALLLGLFSEKLLPDQIVRRTEGIPEFVKRHFGTVCFLFLFGTVAGLYAVNRIILHSFMNSADEHSGYFLAECLRLGKWFVKPHELSEFFNVVHVGNRDGKWFSVYPPGWPLILALGLEWGMKDWLNPVMCTLSLVFLFLAGKKVYGFTAAWLGILFMIVSPFFAFTSASYFTHGTCLLSISIFLYAFLRWGEKRSSDSGIFWSFLAALALGYGLNTRYLTMAAIALPFLAYHGICLATKKIRWNRSDTVFFIVLGVMVCLVFAHNYTVTGKIFKAPNRYDKGWERLGFHSNYTVLDAAIYVLARFFFLADWFPSALIVLFLVSLFEAWDRDPLKRLFRFGFFYLVIAYFFYYSWGGNQYGPRYYYEGLPFLALALGDRLRGWWKRGRQETQKFLLGVLLVSISTSGYLFYKQAQGFETVSRERKALYELAERALERPSIVFIKGFLGDKLVMAQEDTVRNAPRLDAKILYAHDLGEKNQLLKEYYPDREFYRGTFDRTRKEAHLERL